MPATALRFLAGGGQLGRRIRQFDWGPTPLGQPELWPQALKTALSLLLTARHPVLVAWGPELTCFYNDACLPFLGRRGDDALGRPLLEVFGESWQMGQSAIDRLMAGEAVWFEDRPFSIAADGVRRRGWFTVSIMPLRDEQDEGLGLFCSATDTTARVEAERGARFLAELTEALRAAGSPRDAMSLAVRELGRVLEADRCGFAEVDADEARVHIESQWTDAHAPPLPASFPLQVLWPQAVAELRAGVTVVSNDVPRDLRDQAPDVRQAMSENEFGAVVATPLVHEGRLAAMLYVQSRSPRVWTAGEVDLVVKLGARTWSAVEQARADRVLRAREEQIRLATEAAEVGLWDVDPASGTLFWQPRVKAMFGIGDDEPVTLDDFYAGLHPDDRDRVSRAFADAQDPARRALYDVECRVIRRDDGTVRWIASKGRGLFDGEGRCIRVIGSVIDITARRQAAERLEASEAALARTVAMLDALIANAPIGFAFFDRQGRYVRVNQVAAQMHALPPEAHIGLTPREVIPELAAFVERHIEHVIGTGAALEPGEFETPEPSRPGELRAWISAFFPVFDENGEVAFVGATIVDITARRLAEAAVRHLNRTLEGRIAQRTLERDRLWRNSQDLQAILDRSGVIRAVSPAVTRILGWSEDEMVGRPLGEFVVSEEGGGARPFRDGLTSLESRFETCCRAHDGQERWISWLAAPEEDLVYASGRDVTEERVQAAALSQAEEALRQAQKMEAVGQLTGGIAHDFNNLLQGVSGSLDLIRRHPHEVSRVKRWAEAGLQAAERGARLTAQLLAFSRAQKLEIRTLAVRSLLLGMREMLARTLGPGFRIRVEATEELFAAADEIQLEMAVLNLAINARDAMGESGELTIGAVGRVLATGSFPAAGDFVEIYVRDTGSGMPPEVAARAFDPFFTTKPVGKGSGLGLSQVYGMVRQAGGAVHIDSVPGAGTTVRMMLPRAAPTIETVGEAPVARPAPARHASILVVDDDSDVRRFLGDCLATLGYRAMDADDGAAALSALEMFRPDAMIVDFAMPGMNGAEVAAQARALRPTIPIVFVSGFADTGAIEAAVGVDALLLRKPFGLDELQAALGAILPRDEPAASPSSPPEAPLPPAVARAI